MKKIKSLSEIDYSKNETVSFNATVISFITAGDGDKKPFKFGLMLEDSGEQIQVASWHFEFMDRVAELVKTADVCEFSGIAGNFGNYGDQIRIGGLSELNMRSSRKVVRTADVTAIKQEMVRIIDTYIPKSSVYRFLLDKLILENDKFWTHPAATKVHHAYPGGLARHSLNVCKNALDMWKLYEGENLDVEALVAGALLHDIGKLDEYKADGSRTIYGDFIPHSISGYQKIISTAYANNVNPINDIKLVILSHIILSHHGKHEFGAPVLPRCLEALIVSRADALDAAIEGSNEALSNTTVNTATNSLVCADGLKMFKWH